MKKAIPRNNKVYTHLSSEYFIKGNPQLDEYAHNAHALYNRALFDLRQGLFKKEYINSYVKLDSLFKKRYQEKELMLYHSLGYVQSAQQTLKEVMTIWQAWFKALKAYKANPSKFTGKPKMPKYLRKGERHIFFVTNQNAKIKDGYLVIPKFNFKLKIAKQVKTIQRVAFKPVYNGYKVIIQYKIKQSINYLPDNGKYVGIDPGVDNAFACASNTGDRPLLINGRGLKSVNQFYNKERSRLKALQAHYHQLESKIQTKQSEKFIYQETKAMKKLLLGEMKKLNNLHTKHLNVSLNMR